MKYLLGIIAAACIAVGVAGQSGVPISEYAETAVEWFSVASGQPEIVVVDESSTRPPAVAAIYLSKAVADAASGCKSYRWVDPDTTGPSKADVQWALDKAKGNRCVVIRRGTKIVMVAIPATPDAMVALMKKYGAK